MLKKNDILRLSVESVTNLGFGVAHDCGMVIFVGGAVSGDVCDVKIIKTTPSYAVGRVEKFIKRSELRTEGRCSYTSCSSCAYKAIKYEEELKIKRRDVKSAFEKAGLSDATVNDPIPSPSLTAYRNKAQYPVSRGADGALKIGFYAPKSHNVKEARNCPLSPAVFGEIIDTVAAFLDYHSISAYDEESGQGIVRHIYLRRGEVSGEVLLTLVINADGLPYADLFVHDITEKHPCVVGILLNTNKRRTNIILGDEYIALYGRDHIFDTLGGVRLKISAPSFYQVNHDAAELLYAKAKELLTPTKDDVLLDLYCGAGSIGLSMAREVGELVGIEIVDSAVICARENAAEAGITNAHFYTGDASDTRRLLANAEAHLGRRIKPTAIVLDPPRGGCTEELIEFAAELAPQRIVYISCNPSTLARDVAIFKKFGYGYGDITPFDLFPATGHVETVVLLSRENVKTMHDSTMLCDMHIHSNCSDGSFSPEELINEAKKEGIKAIALCDHNTISGLTRFVNASKDSGVIAVPGVEVTSAYKGKEVHILGLFLKESQYPRIAEYLEQINIRKIENNKLLAKRMKEGGFAINYEAVLNIAGDAIPNRVHFAKALLEKGYVSSVSEAFETVLAENGVFYKPAEKLDALEVVRFLRSVGAVPVLAHPFLNFSYAELCKFLSKAKKCGLVGMETVYPLFSEEEADLAKSLAKEYGLIPSGGSDFHGTNKPDIKMGRGKDNITVPYQFYENLKKASDSLPNQITDEAVLCIKKACDD